MARNINTVLEIIEIRNDVARKRNRIEGEIILKENGIEKEESEIDRLYEIEKNLNDAINSFYRIINFGK